ncbi:MAG: hypothetical protein HC869_05715 [Rhodospirillales bacterium]|nr:hypothetical protein [Rhodospirillales bacterium]
MQGAIWAWNAGAVRIFGIPQDVTLGRSLDIIITDLLRQYHRSYRDMVEAGWSRCRPSGVRPVPAGSHTGKTISMHPSKVDSVLTSTIEVHRSCGSVI